MESGQPSQDIWFCPPFIPMTALPQSTDSAIWEFLLIWQRLPLSGIVAQRLVKLLCPNCRQPYEPDEREQRIFAERGRHIPDRLWRSAGCPLCGGTGYTGRTAVYEIMDVDEQIKAMILDNEPLSSIREYQEKKGSMPLRDHVLRMAADGETDMEEAEKILYSVQ